jgi:hypothetical protein
MTEKNVYTIKEFTVRNSVSRAKLYLEIAAGRITIRKIGKRSVITAQEEARWLGSLPAFKPVGVSANNDA